MRVDKIQSNQSNFKALELMRFSRSLRRELPEKNLKALEDSFKNNEFITRLCDTFKAKAYFDGTNTKLGAKASLKLKLKDKHQGFFRRLFNFKKPHEIMV